MYIFAVYDEFAESVFNFGYNKIEYTIERYNTHLNVPVKLFDDWQTNSLLHYPHVCFVYTMTHNMYVRYIIKLFFSMNECNEWNHWNRTTSTFCRLFYCEFDTFCNLGIKNRILQPKCLNYFQVTMNIPFIYCSNQCICIKKHNFVEPRFYYIITSVFTIEICVKVKLLVKLSQWT